MRLAPRLAMLSAGAVGTLAAASALALALALGAKVPPAEGLGVVVGLGAAGTMAAAAGAWMLGRRMARRLAGLDAAAQALARGEATKLDVAGEDEIGALADSFNCMATAVSEREQRLRRLALADPDTELPNRLALERRLAEAAAAGPAVVAAVAIDRFEELRGAIGDGLAATLMRALARRLADHAPGALVGHSSADTLAAVFAADLDAARAAVGEMLSALAAPIQIAGAAVQVSATAGLAAAGAGTPGATLREAAAAVAQARAARQSLAVFDAAAYGDPAQHLALMGEMLDAIDAGQIALHHQPKYDIRQGRVVAVEALVRWTHPKRGLLAPDVFIGLAEQTGHIGALTECVLAAAMDDQRALARSGHQLEMSVNLSGRVLADPAFVARAPDLAARADGRLCFEVTEAALAEDPDRALAHVERLAEAGLGITIDDYGLGPSSLARLRQLRAEELKLDKSFALALADGRKDALIVRSTIDLAHGLGSKVTAKGVETNEAFALLAGMGCDFAQGFLIERPMPLAELLSFLKEDRGGRRRFG